LRISQRSVLKWSVILPFFSLRKSGISFWLSPKYKEKYILVYQLGINKEIVDFARRLHNKTGYRIVYIPFPLVGLLKCDARSQLVLQSGWDFSKMQNM